MFLFTPFCIGVLLLHGDNPIGSCCVHPEVELKNMQLKASKHGILDLGSHSAPNVDDTVGEVGLGVGVGVGRRA